MSYDQLYSYSIPDAMRDKVLPGCRVMVPFGGGNRVREGFVLEIGYEEVNIRLKPVSELIDETPLIQREMLPVIDWIRRTCLCTWADACRLMIPAGISGKPVMVYRLAAESEHPLALILSSNQGEMDEEALKLAYGRKDFVKQITQLTQEGLVISEQSLRYSVRHKQVRGAFLLKDEESVRTWMRGPSARYLPQIRICELLLEYGWLPVPELLQYSGAGRSSLETLVKNDVIGYEERTEERIPEMEEGLADDAGKRPELTMEQRLVVDKISAHIGTGNAKAFLLHGVTGSGKTEVYLQLMEQAQTSGLGVILLVPEISLTPQTVARIAGRFGNSVAVLHSRLSLGERHDQWHAIRDGRIHMVVGPRSAVFAPLQKPGLIILDEEHESSYKSEKSPRYHAADVAWFRCKEQGAILLHGSATPSLESFERCLRKEMTLLTMTARPQSRPMPEVKIVDMRQELEAGNKSMFCRDLYASVKQNLEKKEQSMLLINRRGHSGFMLCRQCGYTLLCPHCRVSLTMHKSHQRGICHYCGFTTVAEPDCPRCHSRSFRLFSAGTERVVEEIEKLFPEARVLRMDADTTTGKDGHSRILRAFRNREADIMVGTQMIAKGHDFPGVTLSAVLAADALLNTGDLRSAERTFSLLTQMAGRAGRSSLPGKVIVQTYNPDHHAIQCASKHDTAGFVRQELELRKLLHYPPFFEMGVAVFSGEDDREAFEQCKEWVNVESERIQGSVEISSPVRAWPPKISGKYRWKVTLKASDRQILEKTLRPLLGRKKSGSSVQVAVDIGPLGMI